MTIRPDFDEAMCRYLQAVDQYGDQHPTTQYLWTFVIDTAPPDFQRLMRDQANELDLLPEPEYTDKGEPVYRLDAIASKLGMSMDEAEQRLHELCDIKRARGCDPGVYTDIKTHRRH